MANNNLKLFLPFLFAVISACSSSKATESFTGGFHSGSRVYEIGPGLNSSYPPTGTGYYRIGVEAIFIGSDVYNGHKTEHDFPFQITPGKKLYSIQGTAQFGSPCTAEYLATIEIDGYQIPLNDRVTLKGNGNSTLFVRYEFPNGIEIPTGKGNIHAEAFVYCASIDTSWEFQGVIETR